MLRSVVHKKDSFLVKYVLKNELNETLVKPYIETNVDTDLFDIEHKGIQNTWWHPARPGQHFVWAEILRAKDTTPEGYYRFKNPIAYYKLESDADTDPHRAVSLTPVDVILTTKHVVLCIDKPNWDSTKPYADTILEKLRNVFRVVEKNESTNEFDVAELMAGYWVQNSVTMSYSANRGIGFGVEFSTFDIYKEETAESDVLGNINFFGFNLPSQITVAKAGETVRYYDLKYIQDNEVLPLVVDANDPTKAYVLLRPGSTKILIAENSFLERDEIWCLLANILAIENISNREINYYFESSLKDTFRLPDHLMLVTLAWGGYILTHKRGDGRLNLTANTDISDRIAVSNYSKDPKTVSKYSVFVNGVEVNSVPLDVTIGVYSGYTFDITIPAQPPTVVTDEAIGTGDGSTTKFHLSKAPVKEESEKIYVNGELKTRGTDYEINYENGEITFTTAPADGATITADYTYYVQFKISFLDPNGNELAKLDRLATFE